MAPKKRNKDNSDLPRRWRWKGNGKGRAIYYRVPPGAEQFWDNKTEFKLGNTQAEAHMTFAQRVGYEGKVVLMEHLCDRYTKEIISAKAPATRKSNLRSMGRIREVFEGNKVAAVQPPHLYQYQDWCIKKHGTKYAALDHEVLSHMFTCAIKWGVIAIHPMTGKKVVKPSVPPRDVEPIHSEIVAFIGLWPRKWQIYLMLKAWTARRKGEMLRLQKFDVTEKGLRFRNNKPPYKKFTLPWEPETLALVNELQALPGAQHNTYLWEARGHKCYVNEDGETSGFDSMWQRRMTQAVKDGIVTVRFTEHDLRKFRPNQLSAAEAQELLRHTSLKQTETYRPNPVIGRIGSKK